MNPINKHFNKENLHHAYLIEGSQEEVVPEVIKFCESIGVPTSSNPDFCHITLDSFKISEAFDLRAMSTDKSFDKKIFLICFNNITLDAENVLLKMFEEPIPNTHFFVVVPDTNALLQTLVSRFYLIKSKNVNAFESEVKEFVSMPLPKRINFIKNLLAEAKEDDLGAEPPSADSARSRALRFLNALEVSLSTKPLDANALEHVFKVREFLRMPGSSVKTLMESVALVVPNL